MRIKKIQLKNGYKRFFDLTIDLGERPKKIIALVGPNGSGKSSVFDGMVFLNGLFGNIGQFGRKDNWFHSMLGNRIGRDDVLIDFDTGENFQKVWNKRNKDSHKNTIFSFRNSYRYNSNLNIVTLEKVPDVTENNKGASSSADLDDKMGQNYQRLYIYINEYRKRNKLTDEEAIRVVIGQLNDILETCLELRISDYGDIMAGKGTLYFTKPNQPREFSFNVLSSGEKEVVDILLDIFLKKDEFNESIYIIDEPELHINTAIQRKLLVEIEKLIPDTCQLWVATHSIGFLNALQKDLNDKSDIIDFTGDFSNEAKVLTPMPKNRKNWQRLFSIALEDLTGLLAPETIIYCEGKVEPNENGGEQGLDAEVYNEIFSGEFPQAFFVSSGGNTEPLEYGAIALQVLNKAFNDVRLLLLRDKDINRNGTPTSDEQRTEFLNSNPSLHRMLERREIENYLFDYEIIHKAYPSFEKETYNQIIPDILDDVKSKSGILMRLCGESGRGFNKEQFKKKLAHYVTPETEIYKSLKSAIFG